MSVTHTQQILRLDIPVDDTQRVAVGDRLEQHFGCVGRMALGVGASIEQAVEPVPALTPVRRWAYASERSAKRGHGK